MYIFSLDGMISEREKLSIGQICERDFEEPVLITSITQKLELNLDPEIINSVSSLVSIVVSIIALYITFKREGKEDIAQNITILDFLKAKLGENLKKYGIEDYKITKIEGFSSFLKGKGNCKFYISSEQSTFYITMSKHGDTHIIQIS